ncbi:MAG: hypothetical protein ACFFCW_30785 [Candidatus Hodarchaeota archaeon]
MNKLSPRQIDALNRIERHQELQPFFFKKAKGLKWFDEFDKRGFFDPGLNPMPVESEDEGFWRIRPWPVLEYLVATAPELENPENGDYVEKYLNIIRSVTWKAMESGQGNYRTWWQFATIINHIPIDAIKHEDIQLCDYWLKDRFHQSLVADELGNRLLLRLLGAKTPYARQLSLKLLESLTELRWVERSFAGRKENEPAFHIEPWHAQELFRNVAFEVGKATGSSGIEIFKKRVEEILETTQTDHYSTIWRPAIEDHEQNVRGDDAIDILISALRDGLDGYVESEPDLAADYISSLLGQKYNVLKRVAIYITSNHFDLLKSIAVSFLTKDFFNYDFQHELYHFLSKNFVKLSEDHQLRVIEIIDRLEIDSDLDEETRKARLAYQKLVWFSGIKGQGNDSADRLYQHYLEIAGVEPEHPDFSSYMKSGWVGQITPYPKEELLSRKIDDLVHLLNSFREERGWEKPSLRGLAEEFKRTVKYKPDYFDGELAKFVNGDLAFSYEIIQAYKELWEEKQYDNWGRLLDFCYTLVTRPDFWEESLNQGRGSLVANRSWIVGAIGELILCGTRDDKKAFDAVHLPKAKELLMLLLANQEGEGFKTDSDAVFVTINSPRGKCVEALVDYALRRARLAHKEVGGHEEVWAELKPLFDQELERAKGGIYEFVTLFSLYLPNFLFLDSKWTLDNLPSVFSKDNRLQWLCAMTGYARVNKVFPEIYSFLKANGHFMLALDSSELKDEIKGKVIQNIVIAYIYGNEFLSDPESLINALITRTRYDEYRRVIWFIWTLRDLPKEDLNQKVLELWPQLESRINRDTKEGKKLYSRLCMWSVFMDDLSGDGKDLLMRAAPFADVDHDAYILIGSLKNLADKYPHEVGEVYLAMLEGCSPTYPEEDIEKILKTLWYVDASGRQMVDSICDKYISYGIGFPSGYRKKLINGTAESV